MYQKVFVPMRLESFIAVALPLVDGLMGVFSLYRSPEGVPFSEFERDRFSNLIPHLKRAVRLQEQFLKMEKERWAALSVLDELPLGVVVVDEQTRVQFANQIARQLMEEENGLLLRHNELWANRRSDSDKMRGLVRKAIHDHQPYAIQLPRDGERKSLHIRINSLKGGESGVFIGDLSHLAVLYVTDPERPQEAHSELLQRLFGLTPAESRLTVHLVLGDTLNEAAEQMGVAKSTARTQLLSVFGKTNTNRQSDLIKAVVTSPLWMSHTSEPV